jgi:hypothetical protein
MSPPDRDELPDFWYVVDHGTEVGIFGDRCVPCPRPFVVLMRMCSESADNAVAGVVGGHRMRVKGWFEAVALYNVLYRQGNIIRVRA